MKRILIILATLITINSNATDCQQLITTAKNYVNTYIVPNGNNMITGTRANVAFNYIINALKCADTIQDLSFTKNASLDSFVIVYKGVRFAVKDSIGSGGGSGTVTSIATDLTLTGGTITTSGTLKVDTSVVSTLSALKDSIDNLRNVIIVTDTTLYTVISSLNTPPASPNIGDVYLVGNSPTGLWLGHDKDVATWDGSIWTFIDGVQGNFLYNASLGITYIFRSGNWVQTGGIPILHNGNTITGGVVVGTNNNTPLVFETQNIKRGRFDSIGNFYLYNTPNGDINDTFVVVQNPTNGKLSKIGKSNFAGGGGGSILSLFANGIEIVTESRTLQPSDASKILIISTGVSLYYGTMPNLSTLGIYILDGDNVNFETQNGSLTKGLTGEFVFLIFDSISQSYQMISSSKINDGGLEKTALRYLYDKSQNAIPLTGTEVGKPVTGDIDFANANIIFNNIDGDKFIKFGFNTATDETGLYFDNGLDPQTRFSIYNGNIQCNMPIGSYFSFANDYLGFSNNGNSSFVGIRGGEDYSNIITDLDYTQKKYVDDKSPSIFGQATLSAGTVTVTNPNIQTTSIIICTANGIINSGFISVTKNSGVGFTIESSNILDGRTVDYIIKY